MIWCSARGIRFSTLRSDERQEEGQHARGDRQEIGAHYQLVSVVREPLPATRPAGSRIERVVRAIEAVGVFHPWLDQQRLDVFTRGIGEIVLPGVLIDPLAIEEVAFRFDIAAIRFRDRRVPSDVDRGARGAGERTGRGREDGGQQNQRNRYPP